MNLSFVRSRQIKQWKNDTYLHYRLPVCCLWLQMLNGSRSFGGVSQTDNGPRLVNPRQKKRRKVPWRQRLHNCIYSLAIDIHQDYKFGYSYYISGMSQLFDAAEGMAAYTNLQCLRPKLHSSARFPGKLRLNTEITID